MSDTCDLCQHQWHGMICGYVVVLAKDGRIVDSYPCVCPSSFRGDDS